MSSGTERLPRRERAILLAVARDSIRNGLDVGAPLSVDPKDYPQPLRPTRASFVTLELEGQLRGCIGALEACQPLVADVAQHAWAAAFRDPRFRPLEQAEYPRLELHLSILSPSEPLRFDSEATLLAQLRPGVDGLILSLGHHQGTFLPAVWEQVPNPKTFLNHLKLKAGLAADFWSEQIRVERYTTESFGEEADSD